MAGDTHSEQARAQTLQRAKQIFELRLRGATFDEIARLVGMHRKGVEKAYYRELAGISKDARERLQKEQKERIDRRRSRLWTRFEGTNDIEQMAQLNRELTRLDLREAKLFGLDEPTKVDLSAEISTERDGRLADLAKLVRAMPDEDRVALQLMFERAKQRLIENSGNGRGSDPEQS